jgi:hypothetical protein
MSGTPSGDRGDTVKFPYGDTEYYGARKARTEMARKAEPMEIYFGNYDYEAVVNEKKRLQKELSEKGLFPSDKVREIRDQLRYKGSLTKEEVNQLNKLEKNLYVRLWYMLSDLQNLLDDIQEYDSSEEKRKYYDRLQNLSVEGRTALEKLKAKIARMERWIERKRRRTRSRRRAQMKGRRRKPGPEGGYGRNGLVPLRF